MKKLVGLCLGMFLAAVSLSVRAEVIAPDALVKNTAQEVLDIVKKDKDIRAGDKKKVLGLVEAKVLPNFDFERMTRLAVGKSWRAATPEQRTAMVTEFRNLLVRTYTNAFTRYQDQTIDVKPLRMPAGADEATVRTAIIKQGAQPITVDYEMEKTENGWKVFDLVVEGVSLVTTYRSTFAEQIAQSGIDGLIKMLESKNAANEVSGKGGK